MAKQKKKRTSLADMNARETLYGSPLTTSRIIQGVMGFEILTIAFSLALYWYWWLTLILCALIFWWYMKWLLPKQVQQRYVQRGFNERNRFVNIMTQGLTNPNANILSLLRSSIDKLHGEFQEEILELTTVLMASMDRKTQHEAFTRLIQRYPDDFYFGLFMEQVETVVYESQYHIETFQTFKDSHNQIALKTKQFIAKKNEIKHNFIVMHGISFLLIMSILISGGWAKAVRLYDHSPIGWVISTVYLSLLLFMEMYFYKRYYDDSVTTL